VLRRVTASAIPLLVALVAVPARPAAAYNVQVAWLPVTGAAGYVVYERREGQGYGAGNDVGPVAPGTDGVLRNLQTGLAFGVTYYFAVTSYNSDHIAAQRVHANAVGVAESYAVEDTAATDPDSDGNVAPVVDAKPHTHADAYPHQHAEADHNPQPDADANQHIYPYTDP